jgi:hypothetical protein
MQSISGISYYQILISSLEEHLKKLGYQLMLEIYMKLNPSLCEPPSTRLAVRAGFCPVIVTLNKHFYHEVPSIWLSLQCLSTQIYDIARVRLL